MTNIEQFEKDKILNANNILFTMTDDEVMGKREQGFYVKEFIDNGNECLNFIFDNGHKYILDKVEQMLYLGEPIPEEYFIHKFLEKEISDFITKWSITNLIEDFFLHCSESEIQAKSLIRLLPYREEKIVYLTNIMIPIELKHIGLGKSLLKKVFNICQRLNYRLILQDVVESFSKSLKNRNAKFLDFDTIEITKDTNLN
ncbi:hypothetical protein KO566_05220 [Flavobacteriaceae bacterium XHP0103]|uniref:hypothetical protein n=1 Tax=Marixanthotalea marina TaxID=2844359 RepID=UPI002989FF66|nr:hypothetical protein [Marixanthotalea marina]MBU3821452.1 hypothetical protein [Marixanthotalea marina]